jgi:hypothetical protein
MGLRAPEVARHRGTSGHPLAHPHPGRDGDLPLCLRRTAHGILLVKNMQYPGPILRHYTFYLRLKRQRCGRLESFFKSGKNNFIPTRGHSLG